MIQICDRISQIDCIWKSDLDLEKQASIEKNLPGMKDDSIVERSLLYKERGL